MDEKQKEKIKESVKAHWKKIRNTDEYKQRCDNMSNADKGRHSFWKGKSNPSLIGNTNAKGSIPWNKGIPMDKITKEKVSKSKVQNPTKYWLGKKRPELHNIKGFDRTGISPWNKDKICPQLAKENHWNWQNGVSSERHSYFFKKLSKILRHKCNHCNLCNSSEDLVVHHLNEMKQDNHLENLIVLCRSCHAQIHSMRLLEARIR